ncbi:hypothetical protein TNCV_4228211 [Trichonephila clavipes]|nr:hypothetical protein TNCV_4228211 [Trichonephila clavipes]
MELCSTLLWNHVSQQTVGHRLNSEDLALENEKVLENLMTFLRHEVEGEEHRILGENGFGSRTKRMESHKQVQRDDYYTSSNHTYKLYIL